VLLALGILGPERRVPTRGTALTLIALVVVLVTVCVRHVSGLPFGLTAVVPGVSAEMSAAIVAASAFTTVFAAAFLSLASYLWRSSGRPRSE
jgi:hypothetical protein